MTPTPAPEPNTPATLSQADFRELLHEKLRGAIARTLTTILEEEVTAFTGAPYYGRTASRRDQRNGYYTRDGHHGWRGGAVAGAADARRVSDPSV